MLRVRRTGAGQCYPKFASEAQKMGEFTIIFAALIVAAAILLGAAVRTYGESPTPVGRFQFYGGAEGPCRVLNTKTGAL
jgi:hypothetical protein